jgi:hypothetical protein
MFKKVGILILICMLSVAGSALAQTPKKGGTLIFGRGGDSVGLTRLMRQMETLL